MAVTEAAAVNNCDDVDYLDKFGDSPPGKSEWLEKWNERPRWFRSHYTTAILGDDIAIDEELRNKIISKIDKDFIWIKQKRRRSCIGLHQLKSLRLVVQKLAGILKKTNLEAYNKLDLIDSSDFYNNKNDVELFILVKVIHKNIDKKNLDELNTNETSAITYINDTDIPVITKDTNTIDKLLDLLPQIQQGGGELSETADIWHKMGDDGSKAKINVDNIQDLLQTYKSNSLYKTVIDAIKKYEETYSKPYQQGGADAWERGEGGVGPIEQKIYSLYQSNLGNERVPQNIFLKMLRTGDPALLNIVKKNNLHKKKHPLYQCGSKRIKLKRSNHDQKWGCHFKDNNNKADYCEPDETNTRCKEKNLDQMRLVRRKLSDIWNTARQAKPLNAEQRQQALGASRLATGVTAAGSSVHDGKLVQNNDTDALSELVENEKKYLGQRVQQLENLALNPNKITSGLKVVTTDEVKTQIEKTTGTSEEKTALKQGEESLEVLTKRTDATIQKTHAKTAKERKDAEEAMRNAENARLKLQAKREAEEQARREAEEKKEAAKREAEEKKEAAKREAEERARREAEEKKEAAKREAEERARREAEEQAKLEAKEQAKREAEEQANREAEEQAKREAEDKARREAEEKKEAAKRETEAKAKREAEAKAKREAEAKAKREAEKAKRQKLADAAEKRLALVETLKKSNPNDIITGCGETLLIKYVNVLSGGGEYDINLFSIEDTNSHLNTSLEKANMVSEKVNDIVEKMDTLSIDSSTKDKLYSIQDAMNTNILVAQTVQDTGFSQIDTYNINKMLTSMNSMSLTTNKLIKDINPLLNQNDILKYNTSDNDCNGNINCLANNAISVNKLHVDNVREMLFS